MHTVERLELALEAARQAGFTVRLEWMGGSGGGACLVAGRKLLLIDLAQSHEEQLGAAIEALREDPITFTLPLHPALARELGIRRAA